MIWELTIHGSKCIRGRTLVERRQRAIGYILIRTYHIHSRKLGGFFHLVRLHLFHRVEDQRRPGGIKWWVKIIYRNVYSPLSNLAMGISYNERLTCILNTLGIPEKRVIYIIAIYKRLYRPNERLCTLYMQLYRYAIYSSATLTKYFVY